MITVLSLFNSVYTGVSATVNPLMVALSFGQSYIRCCFSAAVSLSDTLYKNLSLH